MENETNTAVRLSATIYVCAGSGSPKGPFGWCTRIVTPEAVQELAGASGDVNFSHLYTSGTIAALDALPQSSEVHVVCSDHNAIGRFAVAGDVALGRNRKRWKAKSEAILKLCRDLHRAVQRHATVTTKIVALVDAQEEQLAAHLRVTQAIDEFLAEADFDEPAPDRSMLRVVKPAGPQSQETSLSQSANASVVAEQRAVGGPGSDVPW